MITKLGLIPAAACLLIAGIALPGCSSAPGTPATILLAVVDREETPPVKIAIDRLRAYSSAAIEVVHGAPEDLPREADLVVSFGVNASPRLSAAKEDSYLVETVSQSPLTIVATGTNERAMLADTSDVWASMW